MISVFVTIFLYTYLNSTYVIFSKMKHLHLKFASISHARISSTLKRVAAVWTWGNFSLRVIAWWPKRAVTAVAMNWTNFEKNHVSLGFIDPKIKIFTKLKRFEIWKPFFRPKSPYVIQTLIQKNNQFRKNIIFSGIKLITCVSAALPDLQQYILSWIFVSLSVTRLTM